LLESCACISNEFLATNSAAFFSAVKDIGGAIAKFVVRYCSFSDVDEKG
jgi:hypothetical protein